MQSRGRGRRRTRNGATARGRRGRGRKEWREGGTGEREEGEGRKGGKGGGRNRKKGTQTKKGESEEKRSAERPTTQIPNMGGGIKPAPWSNITRCVKLLHGPPPTDALLHGFTRRTSLRTEKEGKKEQKQESPLRIYFSSFSYITLWVKFIGKTNRLARNLERY